MNLPSTRPCWYGISEPEAGWIPKTEDIGIIKDTWKNHIHYENSNATVKIEGLKPISPIQVGGGSLPEDHILPANIAGVPVIPGSSLRGAFLNWMRKTWDSIEEEEKLFWEELIDTENWRWKPRKIRFENINVDDLLKPFPLNPQQEWQIFYDQSSRNKLGVQWQIPAVEPSKNINPPVIKNKNVTRPLKVKGSLSPICIQINNSYNISEIQKEWLANRFQAMLKEQGVGRGTASGFGRIAKEIPNQGTWEIKLTGMKPCIDAKKELYRWNPQVLRACLRGYFTRLALGVLLKEGAKELTNRIFGSTDNRGKLTLTSYLSNVDNSHQNANHQLWLIQIDCNPELKDLINNLLKLASSLGGLGPGWKRPFHSYEKSFFNLKENKEDKRKLDRGNQFEISQFSSFAESNFQVIGQYLNNLISQIKEQIVSFASQENISVPASNKPELGMIFSIWFSSNQEQWRKIVHGICSTKTCDKSRPEWCGDHKNRPSGYSVRQHDQFCLITVFDPLITAVSDSIQDNILKENQFQLIWGLENTELPKPRPKLRQK
ncbi:MAG TPA: RAMP superfamily CRISPR-associated protein [Candidatus Obscuribacterales bacterium]